MILSYPFSIVRSVHYKRRYSHCLREHFAAPASHGGKNSRSQIPCRVDRVTTVESKRHADQEHDETDDERREARARLAAVLFVDQGEDKCDQHGGAEEL